MQVDAEVTRLRGTEPERRNMTFALRHTQQQRRRLATVLAALQQPDRINGAAALTSSDSTLRPGGSTQPLAADHPSFGSAPIEWKLEPDVESAARFKQGRWAVEPGRLTTAEQQTLREELLYFRTYGCMLVPNVLVGEQLARLQQAYDRVVQIEYERWAATDLDTRGTFAPDLDGAAIFEREPDLLDAIDPPRLLPLLSQCIGEDLEIRQVQTRYNPPGNLGSMGPGSAAHSEALTTGKTVLGWHRDRPNYHNNATGRSMWLKVFIYFYDVAENCAPTALVPQTHLSDLHPRVLPDAQKEDMPGHIRAAGRAGTALLFDTRTWHARTVNTSANARRCMTLNYCQFHHRVSADVQCTAERLDSAGSLSPLRRQLLGIERLYSERRASPQVSPDGIWESRTEMEGSP